jgi:hypothetical protein
MKILRDNLEVGFAVIYNLAVDLCWKMRQTQYMVQDAILYAPRQG